MATRWSKRALVVVTAALVLSACGGKSDGSGSGSTGSTGSNGGKVSASAFAGTVCGAILQWQGDIQSRSDDLTNQLGDSPDPAKGKQVLGDFIDGIITDTDEVLTKLQGAGVPDVDGGSAASNALVTAFQQVKESLQHVRESVEALPTDDPTAFQQAAGSLSTEISSSFDAIATSLQSVQVPALDDAFNSESSCQSVQGG